MYMMPKGIS